MYAIAHALEGMSRAEAARLAGMERQALGDAVVGYNARGLAPPIGQSVPRSSQRRFRYTANVVRTIKWRAACRREYL